MKEKMMATSKRHTYLWNIKRSFKKYWPLYICLLLVLTYYVIFHYAPMMGIQIAFKDYSPSKGIWQSPWVGLKHFKRFFNTFDFTRILKNTVFISLYQLAVGFPIPILLALMLNELRSKAFQKTIQMVTYAPHFISTVVLVGMMSQLFSYNYGLINKVIDMLGGSRKLFLTEPQYFRHLYVWSGVWQGMGYNSIIYISALSSIDPSLYEAAKVDGASRMQRILHIEIPGILPTIITLLILNTGRLLSVGHEKVLLMQCTQNYETSDILSIYIYRMTFKGSLPDYSYTTAIGLFNSVINFVLITLVNAISKRVTETSLW